VGLFCGAVLTAEATRRRCSGPSRRGEQAIERGNEVPPVQSALELDPLTPRPSDVDPLVLPGAPL